MMEEVSVNYNNNETCFNSGNYGDTTSLFPNRGQCVINTGFNHLDVYADPDFGKFMYTLPPGTTTTVPCKPGSVKIY